VAYSESASSVAYSESASAVALPVPIFVQLSPPDTSYSAASIPFQTNTGLDGEVATLIKYGGASTITGTVSSTPRWYAGGSGAWNTSNDLAARNAGWEITVAEGSFSNVTINLTGTGTLQGPGAWIVMHSYDNGATWDEDATYFLQHTTANTPVIVPTISIPGGSGKLKIRLAVNSASVLFGTGTTGSMNGNAGICSLTIQGDYLPGSVSSESSTAGESSGEGESSTAVVYLFDGADFPLPEGKSYGDGVALTGTTVGSSGSVGSGFTTKHTASGYLGDAIIIAGSGTGNALVYQKAVSAFNAFTNPTKVTFWIKGTLDKGTLRIFLTTNSNLSGTNMAFNIVDTSTTLTASSTSTYTDGSADFSGAWTKITLNYVSGNHSGISTSAYGLQIRIGNSASGTDSRKCNVILDEFAWE